MSMGNRNPGMIDDNVSKPLPAIRDMPVGLLEALLKMSRESPVLVLVLCPFEPGQVYVTTRLFEAVEVHVSRSRVGAPSGDFGIVESWPPHAVPDVAESVSFVLLVQNICE
jgi:hypothetical protein